MTTQTISAGTTGRPIFVDDAGVSVTAIPGGGGTLLVQFSTSTDEDINAGIGNWYDWPNGTVSSAASNTLVGRVTAVRGTATAANGTLEVIR